LNKVQFDSTAFQERNGTCGMEPERSGRNLAEKSGTNRDLKWDEIYSVFWIGIKYFGHSRRNGTELTTLVHIRFGNPTPFKASIVRRGVAALKIKNNEN